MRISPTPILAALLLLSGCQEDPKSTRAVEDVPDPDPAPRTESGGDISSTRSASKELRERFDQKLLSSGYELQAMRSFIAKNSEDLSRDEAYSLQKNVVMAAKEHNFEGCLDIVSEDIESFDQELTVGGNLFSWAGHKGPETIAAYLAKIEERSTNPDAFRHYSKSLITGTMASERSRIDNLIDYILKLEDPEKLAHFSTQIAFSFWGPVPVTPPGPDGIASNSETPSKTPMENSDILTTLVEKRGQDMDRGSLEMLINRAFDAGVVHDKTATLEKYLKQSD